nr:hypothetical protein [Roseibium hamelinense]
MNEKDLFCDARMYWFDRYVEHQSRKLLGPEARIIDDVPALDQAY